MARKTSIPGPETAALAPAISPETGITREQLEFLWQLAEALNTTLDLETLLHRVAHLVRAVIDYRIFAILLVNERGRDLRMRFQIGHTPEIERLRIPLGRGIVGQAAEQRTSILVSDTSKVENYIPANPDVVSELAIPLMTRNRVIGVIDIQSTQPAAFTPQQQRLLEMTASRVAVAVENARLYTRVARQANTLAVLNDISREISSILDLDQLLVRIGELLNRVIDYRMYSILLMNQRTQLLEHRLSVRFGKVEHFGEDNIPLSQGLVGAAVREGHAILASDVRRDPRYRMVNPETRSELAVPLIFKGKVTGVLDLEHTRRNYFTEEHVRTLSTLSTQIAVAIENAQLYQRVAQEEARMEHDLQMAREVQLRLLPPNVPRVANAEFAARFLPARSIGGDLYDFLDYGDGRIGIAMGDVSGKAAPAALLAALVSGIMRAQTSLKPSPAVMLQCLNSSLMDRKLDAQYVTMLYGVWDDKTRTLTIANAGAIQPLYATANGIRTINVAGFPLGMFPSPEYDELSITAKPSEAIVFFSDGMVDAENDNEDMFGDDRLEKTIAANRKRSASQMVDAVLTAVTAFQGGREHFDDETILALRVL